MYIALVEYWEEDVAMVDGEEIEMFHSFDQSVNPQ